MKTYKYPTKEMWKKLIERPSEDFKNVISGIQPVLDAVKSDGDNAVCEFTLRFDNISINEFLVEEQLIADAEEEIPVKLKSAIDKAYENIWKFHKIQVQEEPVIETSPGVFCWRRNVAIEKVGLYIPGGTAPLFSTVLMLAIPARIAGCLQIIICTPCRKDGYIHPAILYTAYKCGVNTIFKVGGAQAIAAMAYGTQSIPKVDKIFGPGNQYVTAAKQKVAQDGVTIDMPAGPSELAVIADETCNPAFVAADLLSQAEHGTDSQVMLITMNEPVARSIEFELQSQLRNLPRYDITAKAVKNSKIIILQNIDEAMQFVNLYAPEHLILVVKDYKSLIPKIVNAGSVFLGNYSPESAGDYASGTNHTLPTNGFARSYSGVSVESFVKKITFQEINADGLKNIGPAIEEMAKHEGLDAHKNAVTIRTKNRIK
ncbi:MAG: histidinol dehydrogenase [Calditrichia bacterium]|nr:histidinol dehydrogenase [Calditrichia bacterium]